MRILIIEDEERAAAQLQDMALEIIGGAVFAGTIDNIQDAIDFLASGPDIDLIFLDIHLSDGPSFEIFKEVKVDIPVIFTTAYDQYAIKAFDVNSIDYLLKPIRKEELQQAIEKFLRLEGKRQPAINEAVLETIMRMIGGTKKYKQNFLVPHKDRLVPVSTDEFAFFDIVGGVVTGTKFDKKQLQMEEKSLEELAEVLDPARFYRANRQYLVNRKAIREVEYYFNGRLFVRLFPEPNEKVLVSKARASHFKEWMNRE
jgi:two-component system LytT family response regulator